MQIIEWSCEKFVDETFSKAPAPGGGGAAAMAGAIGTALAGMVCNLTTGKKKYAAYEEEIQKIVSEAENLKRKLLELVDRDAENFIPLSKVYGLPAETEEEKRIKSEKMQEALLTAISAPIDIIKLSFEAIKLHERLADIGSALAISDVGCGAVCLLAAMKSGWLNVKINLKSINDTEYVNKTAAELEPILLEGEKLCDEIYNKVLIKIG